MLDSAEGFRGQPVAADPTRLPFPSKQFAGIVLRWQGGQSEWGEVAGELRRVLNDEGALYVEIPAITNLDLDQFVKDTEARLALAYRWRWELARLLAPISRLEETEAFSVAGRIRALCSLGLRASDRFLGTRLARGGMGLYFGKVWNQPDPRARLNGCVRCGTARSRDQIVSAVPLTGRFGLVLYLCPECGAPNILTVDR